MGTTYGVTTEASSLKKLSKNPGIHMQEACIGPYFLRVQPHSQTVKKWNNMIRACKHSPCPLEVYRNNPKRTGRFLRQVKLGPPQLYRWAAWRAIVSLSCKASVTAYHRLPVGSRAAVYAIEKDLDRTFPCHPYFNSEKYEGQAVLARILSKLAGRFPRVGYCQSMNYIVGFLLLVSGGKETEVYFLMETLLTEYNLQALFAEDMRYLKQCLWVLYQLLKRHCPDLVLHLKQQEVALDVWVFKWFMTLFTVSVNHDVAVRVWDFFLVDKMKTIFQLSLALLQHFAPELLQLDASRLCSFFKNLHERCVCSEEVIKLMLDVSLSHAEIADLETAYTSNAFTSKNTPSHKVAG